MKKITLAIPSNRGIKNKTAESALRMIAHSKQYDWHIICPSEGYTIAENRNYMAVQALNSKSDYILMIDDDMTFEPDLLDTLIADKKDIVGVAYHPRCETSQKLGFLDETHIISLEKTDDPKYKDTFKCKAVGTGIMLVNTEVFRKMKRPWFAFEYLDTGQCKVGEDWYFCLKAKEYGIETWCDPKVKIGHLGERIY